MSFDWRDFLLFAHELRNELDESKQRASIGRAYYYVYNVALIEAKELGFNPRLIKGGLHQRLWKWCLTHRDAEIRALGDSGNTLKARRTAADYVRAPSTPITARLVQKQLDEARDFEVLLAQITSSPTPPALP